MGRLVTSIRPSPQYGCVAMCASGIKKLTGKDLHLLSQRLPHFLLAVFNYRAVLMGKELTILNRPPAANAWRLFYCELRDLSLWLREFDLKSESAASQLPRGRMKSIATTSLWTDPVEMLKVLQHALEDLAKRFDQEVPGLLEAESDRWKSERLCWRLGPADRIVWINWRIKETTGLLFVTPQELNIGVEIEQAILRQINLSLSDLHSSSLCEREIRLVVDQYEKAFIQPPDSIRLQLQQFYSWSFDRYDPEFAFLEPRQDSKFPLLEQSFLEVIRLAAEFCKIAAKCYGQIIHPRDPAREFEVDYSEEGDWISLLQRVTEIEALTGVHLHIFKCQQFLEAFDRYSQAKQNGFTSKSFAQYCKQLVGFRDNVYSEDDAPSILRKLEELCETCSVTEFLRYAKIFLLNIRKLRESVNSYFKDGELVDLVADATKPSIAQLLESIEFFVRWNPDSLRAERLETLYRRLCGKGSGLMPYRQQIETQDQLSSCNTILPAIHRICGPTVEFASIHPINFWIGHAPSHPAFLVASYLSHDKDGQEQFASCCETIELALKASGNASTTINSKQIHGWLSCTSYRPCPETVARWLTDCPNSYKHVKRGVHECDLDDFMRLLKKWKEEVSGKRKQIYDTILQSFVDYHEFTDTYSLKSNNLKR